MSSGDPNSPSVDRLADSTTRGGGREIEKGLMMSSQRVVRFRLLTYLRYTNAVRQRIEIAASTPQTMAGTFVDLTFTESVLMIALPVGPVGLDADVIEGEES